MSVWGECDWDGAWVTASNAEFAKAAAALDDVGATLQMLISGAFVSGLSQSRLAAGRSAQGGPLRTAPPRRGIALGGVKP